MQDWADLLIKSARLYQVLICGLLCVVLLAAGLAYGDSAYALIAVAPATVLVVCWRRLFQKGPDDGM